MSVPFAPVRRRWFRTVQWVVFALVAAAMAGILTNVVRTAALTGRMTASVVATQARATTLSTAQRESLQLSLEVSELDDGGSGDAVEVRQGLLMRQLDVAAATFAPTSADAAELTSLAAEVGALDWRGSVGRSAAATQRRHTLAAHVKRIEVRVKELYDTQEKFFYGATMDSLATKRRNETSLVGLLALVVLAGFGWVFALRWMTRSDLARAYAAVARQAFHDSLTGLANRALLRERLERTLETAAAQPGLQVSVLLIDLDGFKNINDTLGHPAGDELLCVTADRLAACVRAEDTPARLGGDEFAVLLVGRPAEGAVAVAERVLASVRQPAVVAGQEVAVGASIGVVHHTGPGEVEELLRRADIAMYAAKGGGKNRVDLFRPEFQERTAERSTLQHELTRAVERGEIELHYQPIVAVGSGEILAVEALARWRHPTRGMVPPGVFVPLAEESGAIAEIGRHVLLQATAAARRWRSTVAGRADLAVTVNVSGRQVLSGDLADHVREALHTSGLAPAALVLEITESVFLQDSDVDEQFRRIKDLGVRIAVDDFGAGYSSLGSLLRFSADVLKIDRTFLEFDTARHGTLVQAVSELGRSLELTVVAEGVETAEQLALVQRAGCTAAQGYHLARPATEDDTELLLHRAGTTGHLADLVTAAAARAGAAAGLLARAASDAA